MSIPFDKILPRGDVKPEGCSRADRCASVQALHARDTLLVSGLDDPLPPRAELRAGPLSLWFEQGDGGLRTVKWGDVEILRRVTVAVRDRNWGTVPPALSNLRIEAGPDSFHIAYDAAHIQGDIDFRWHAEIAGQADGTISCRLDGAARTTFLRNRIGFCVLHPATLAGARCRVAHMDGTVEEARLPDFIVSDQPVQPFADLRALAHQVRPGAWAEVRFSGDVFEMEDQRNWTDASFKTYCTPLSLPYPVEVRAGERVAQAVALVLTDDRRRTTDDGLRSTPRAPRSPLSAPRPTAPVDFELDFTRAAPLPRIGLGAASHRQPLTEREVERLRALRLDHLRIDCRPADEDCEARLRQAAAEARALGATLDVAVFLSAEADQELSRFSQLLDRVGPPVGAWLIYPAQEAYQGGSPTAELVTLARRRLGGYDPAARFGAGTDADFIFLQRNPPPLSMLDFVAFAVNPQVHAFDNSSLVETLEGQAAAVASARRLAGDVPVAVSPVTLKPRRNPYATGPEPAVPPGELPPQVDVRQVSLFGAGWTAASLKRLSEAGASRITYYETTGWRGVMETESSSPLPGKFRSLPGSVFPLYHVFADAAEFTGGEVVASRSGDPLRVDGLALRRGSEVRVIAANFSDQPARVTLRRLGPRARVLLLDETTAFEAMSAPEVFRARRGDEITAAGGALDLALRPYAVLRIDAMT